VNDFFYICLDTNPNYNETLYDTIAASMYFNFYIWSKKRQSKNHVQLINSINSIHHNLQEKSFDELGLNIIWYDDYNEIPAILAMVKG
jgi:hypothetical protein